MECKISFQEEQCADSIFSVFAPGFATVSLFWANADKVLENWYSFAHFPIDHDGMGEFHFYGGRSIPPEATHVCVSVTKEDGVQCEEVFLEVPEEYRRHPMKSEFQVCVMSDLHLSSKAWVLSKAFTKAVQSDALFWAGDMTNDGYQTQFARLQECIQNVIPDIPIFSVCGNHDIPRKGNEKGEESSTDNYRNFQLWLFERIRNQMDTVESDDFSTEGSYLMQNGPDGAYAVRIRQDMEVIGLQAVTDNRQFLFKEGEQLLWLDNHLEESKELKWRFILCHAPLLHHNPKRKAGEKNPYLNRDRQLQEILDRHGNVVFISGHTHLSMNDRNGCVEWDAEHGNIYINDASIRTTDLLPGEKMQPPEWREGCCLYIGVNDKEMEIVTQSIKNHQNHARGYYHIRK